MTNNCPELYMQRHIVQQVGRRLILPAPEIRRDIVINDTSNVSCHDKAETNNIEQYAGSYVFYAEPYQNLLH
jgi:hypothetical protein